MRILLTTVLLFCSTVIIAQTYRARVMTFDRKWGIINEKGKFMVKPVYFRCFPFSEGLAPVWYTKSKLYYFVDSIGNIMEPEINGFDLKAAIRIPGLSKVIFQSEMDGQKGGMIAVRKKGRWGYLNAQGKIAVQLKYDKVNHFYEGFAVAKRGTNLYVINKEGKETKIEKSSIAKATLFIEGLAPFSDRFNSMGYIDSSGKVSIEAKFLRVGYFNEGLAWVKTMDEKIGFINTKGEWVIEPQFLKVGRFVNGLAWVRTTSEKTGYINRQGEWVLEPKFSAGKNFDPVSGMARVRVGDSWAYTNKSGELLYVNDTRKWGDFYYGLARGNKDEKVGYFNNKGEWVIPAKFDIGKDFRNGFAAVRIDGKWGFINTAGELVIAAQFKIVKDMELVE